METVGGTSRSREDQANCSRKQALSAFAPSFISGNDRRTPLILVSGISGRAAVAGAWCCRLVWVRLG